MTQAPERSLLDDVAWSSTLRAGDARAPDGTRIHYEVLGEGDRTVMIANGLGGRLYAWRTLLDALWTRYRLITWDYRGLFDSETPPTKRQLSLVHHVDDAMAVLDAERVERAVFAGWSMGVQVSLDAAATRPARVAGLVLMNGTYGHVLSHGFQPLFSVPWLPLRLHAIVEWLRAHPEAAGTIARITRTAELPTALLLMLTAGRRGLALRPIVRRYFADVLGPSFLSYLFMLQELDAHSVYHLLREIQAPALVVSGLFDPMTPVYQSDRIARRLPNARYLRLVRASHFALLERPEEVIPEVERFLAGEARW